MAKQGGRSINKTPDLGPGWLERTAFAAMLGISGGGFDKGWAKHAGRKQKIGRQVWFHVADLLRNRIAHERERAGDRNGDRDLGGGNSPALEEYRRWRARRERIACQVELKRLVDRREMDAVLDRHFSLIRRAVETIQRSWPEAWKVFDQAQEEAERGTREYLGSEEFRKFRQRLEASDAQEFHPHAGDESESPGPAPGDDDVHPHGQMAGQEAP